jgi:hypothetical protein
MEIGHLSDTCSEIINQKMLNGLTIEEYEKKRKFGLPINKIIIINKRKIFNN